VPKRADRRIDRVPSARFILWAVSFPNVVSMCITNLLHVQVGKRLSLGSFLF
jgi:hypothetical protein